jgi:polar amino acid transport system permease protein
MTFDFGIALKMLPRLLAATLTTVEIAVLGFAVACIVGLVLAMMRMSRSPVIAKGAFAYVELVRLTPLLVQLFFAFYVLADYGLQLSAFLTGVLVLGGNYGAYVSEVYRAGIVGVPRGQWEAALALNLSPLRTWGRIILPQAIRKMIPALGNYLISMFKEVPLLSTITVYELLATANVLGSETFHYLEPLTMVGVIFLMLSYPSSLFFRRLEVRDGR